MPSDGSSIYIGITAILVFLLLKGYFTACETAVTEINDAKLKALAEKDKKARRLSELLKKPARLLTALSVHRILSSVMVAVLSAAIFLQKIDGAFTETYGNGAAIKAVIFILAAAAVVLSVTLVLALFGEAFPKKLLLKGSDEFAVRSAGVLKALVIIMTPLTALVEFLAKLLARIFGVPGNNPNDIVTEEAILMMVDAGNETGVIEESQKEMINNIFEFGDLEISDVMTHRTEITAVPLDAKISDVVYEAINNGFSRIPVYEDTIDSIVGVICVKDLLSLIGCGTTEGINIKDFIRDILYVPETNKCDEVFKKLTAMKAQAAVAIDEYGGTAGFVTMEDLLEAIVGNMQDEYDDENEEITRISENIYTIDGAASPEPVFEQLGISLPEGHEYDTVSGFIIDLLGRIPSGDETPAVTYENVDFTVLLTEDKFISRIKAVVNEKQPAEN